MSATKNVSVKTQTVNQHNLSLANHPTIHLTLNAHQAVPQTPTAQNKQIRTLGISVSNRDYMGTVDVTVASNLTPIASVKGRQTSVNRKDSTIMARAIDVPNRTQIAMIRRRIAVLSRMMCVYNSVFMEMERVMLNALALTLTAAMEEIIHHKTTLQ